MAPASVPFLKSGTLPAKIWIPCGRPGTAVQGRPVGTPATCATSSLLRMSSCRPVLKTDHSLIGRENGPFGFGWDHDYNVYLRELNDGGFALWTGQLHEQHFRSTGDGFEPNPGFAARAR